MIIEHLFYLTLGMTPDGSLNVCSFAYLDFYVIFGPWTTFTNKYLRQFDEMFHSVINLYTAWNWTVDVQYKRQYSMASFCFFFLHCIGVLYLSLK